MIVRALIVCACAATLAACVSPRPGESPEYAWRMREAGDRYTACLTAEAQKDVKNPARAEDIAIAAHGRCWAQWDAYRTATSINFTHGTRSPQELQYARDKSEAHLRHFEMEARRSLVDWVIQQNQAGGSR